MTGLETFVTHTLHGIQYGFVLFLIASGLTIVLGILDVLNLAHGELFALGAYVGFTIIGYLTGLVAPPTTLSTQLVFLGVVLLGAALTAAILVPVGVFLETTFFKPIYGRDEVYQIVLTFALLLIIKDVNKLIWGPSPLRLQDAYGGINSIPVLSRVGLTYPTYNVVIIVIGLVTVAGLFWFFNRTKTGRIIRATAINREMATAIGVNTGRTFTLVFALGAFFAGFAGALALPPRFASLDMGANPLVLSFVVIVIGGLGSLRGAFVAALLVGVLSRWAIWQYPPAELAAPFAIMAIVLLVRPEGLFGTWGEMG
ncbi:branched-chain amino acid ABC transporter permease [Haloferax elongans ATCC BAA-1513]|uniref:Branched-chain amino acid ABC transporter permease n=1 Tax=Haloferax elongans ATCC BAA-1513 TaxID=1230453 RepID=M0HBA2_HALEO|nr:branched-chain amino acid ABC transporter permease [Haloferax elongans]ELZ81063.1 branched-chain amino acid ABC transporter permease [Haloferax elongans ATCC BAA-1513]